MPVPRGLSGCGTMCNVNADVEGSVRVTNGATDHCRTALGVSHGNGTFLRSRDGGNSAVGNRQLGPNRAEPVGHKSTVMYNNIPIGLTRFVPSGGLSGVVNITTAVTILIIYD